MTDQKVLNDILSRWPTMRVWQNYGHLHSSISIFPLQVLFKCYIHLYNNAQSDVTNNL